MPWITNICQAVRFVAWHNADKLASAVLNDHNTLLPETREFLDFYLPHDAFCDELISTATTVSDTTSRCSSLSDRTSTTAVSTATSGSTNLAPMTPLDSLEILLAATTSENPHFPTARSFPVCSEFGHTQNPSIGPPSRIVTVAPHLAVYPPHTLLPATTLPILSIHTTPPTTELVPDGTRASSSRTVATSLNALFADERNANPSRRDIPADQAAMRAVARAVTQALLSSSGCAGLTNGLHALLFQVEPNISASVGDICEERGQGYRNGTRTVQKRRRGTSFIDSGCKSSCSRNSSYNKLHRGEYDICQDDEWCINHVHDGDAFVTVRVSRVFGLAETRADPPAALHALAGLSRYAANLFREDSSLGARIRACAVTVGSAETEYIFDERGAVRWGRSNSTVGFEREGELIDDEDDSEYEFDLEGDVEVDDDDDELISELISRHCGVVGVGNSGVVLESVLDRRRVAVKLWNETDRSGLCDISDEIEMYQTVMTKHPGVAGYAVPRMVLGRVGSGRGGGSEGQGGGKHGAVLVTELVGMGLKRGDEGVLMVGHGDEWDFVEAREEANIVKAAKASLEILHQHGIAHGDVCLENLRVDRRRTFYGWAWHAWWVDLGHAEEDIEAAEGGDEFGMLQFEMEQVERLLDTDR